MCVVTIVAEEQLRKALLALLALLGILRGAFISPYCTMPPKLCNFSIDICRLISGGCISTLRIYPQLTVSLSSCIVYVQSPCIVSVYSHRWCISCCSIAAAQGNTVYTTRQLLPNPTALCLSNYVIFISIYVDWCNTEQRKKCITTLRIYP